jgi:hypothetical protein
MNHDVVIITRDVNGKRTEHYLTWDTTSKYITDNMSTLEEEEILAIFSEDCCLYSKLAHTWITWEVVIGFFA